MPNVAVLVGSAPSETSTEDERDAAERFGYLIDRGDHLEWHQERQVQSWRCPRHPPAGLPVVASVRVGPGRAPGSASLRWARARRHLRRVGEGVLMLVGLVVAIVVSALAFVLSQGRSGRRTDQKRPSATPRNPAPPETRPGRPAQDVHLWFLAGDGSVLATTGGCSPRLGPRFFPDTMLAHLSALGVTYTEPASETGPPD